MHINFCVITKKVRTEAMITKCGMHNDPEAPWYSYDYGSRLLGKVTKLKVNVKIGHWLQSLEYLSSPA